MNTESPMNQQIIPGDLQAEQSTPGLEINNEISTYLNNAGKWTKFLSIVGFVGMGFMVMGGIVLSIVMAFIPSSETADMPFPASLLGLIYVILGSVYFIPLLYLLRFSNSIHQALRLKNQQQLTTAFLNLKKHYKFIGIMMIVMLGLYALLFAIVIIAGLFTGITNMPGIAA